MRASELTELMTTSCADVLDSMYFTSVMETEIETVLPQTLEGPAFELGFSGGDVSGNFGLSVDPSAALTMAANFLGEEESDLSSAEVDEVVGELANMLCGSLVSGIASEQKFDLSHPKPIQTQTLSNFQDSVPRDLLALKLDTDNGVVRVWLVLEQNACAQ